MLPPLAVISTVAETSPSLAVALRVPSGRAESAVAGIAARVSAITVANRDCADPNRIPNTIAMTARRSTTPAGTKTGRYLAAEALREKRRFRTVHVRPASNPQSALAAGAKEQTDL